MNYHFEWWHAWTLSGVLSALGTIWAAIRMGLWDVIKDKLFAPKERREDIITRAEFEARHTELKEDFRSGMVDLGDKLMAHGAQARQDNRDLKQELKADISEIRTDVKETGRDLFNKMDNFLAMISMRGK